MICYFSKSKYYLHVQLFRDVAQKLKFIFSSTIASILKITFTLIYLILLYTKINFTLLILSTRNIQTEPEISKQQNKPHKKYSVITDEKRNFLIKQVLEDGVSVKLAAQANEIKLSTAKAILKTYKTQGRVGKKKERQKRPKLNRKTVEKQLDQATLIKKQLPKLGQNFIYYPYSYQPPPLFYKIEHSNDVKLEI